MSHPGTDPETQTRRHKPALIGIALALAAAALVAAVALILPGLSADEQATPVPTAPQPDAIDGASGAESAQP